MLQDAYKAAVWALLKADNFAVGDAQSKVVEWVVIDGPFWDDEEPEDALARAHGDYGPLGGLYVSVTLRELEEAGITRVEQLAKDKVNIAYRLWHMSLADHSQKRNYN